MDERTSLRRRYRARRRGLSERQQRIHADCIRRLFLASPLLWRVRRIAAYLSVDGEPDLRPLLRRLHELGKVLALPVVEAGNRMSFFVHRPDWPLVVNRFGIEEPGPQAAWLQPLALDLVLTPLTAFDHQGNRLGMGGGFYDRRFGTLPPRMRPPAGGRRPRHPASRETPQRPLGHSLGRRSDRTGLALLQQPNGLLRQLRGIGTGVKVAGGWAVSSQPAV